MGLKSVCLSSLITLGTVPLKLIKWSVLHKFILIFLLSRLA